MGSLYSQPITREYKGQVGNTVVLLLFLDIGLGWIVPFVVAYATGYLWMKEFTYYEQAEVVFLNKARVDVVGAGGEVLEWVSVPEMEGFLGNLVMMRMEQYSEDLDGDGTVDRVFLDVKTKVPDGFVPVGVDGLFFFQWDMKDKIRVSMEAPVQVSFRAAEGIGGVAIDAKMVFTQRYPLVMNPFTDYDEIYNVSLFDQTTVTSPTHLTIPFISASYGSRNETLSLAPTSTTHSPSAGGVFALSLILRNPSQPITHTANLPLLLKFGLVQYFALWYIFTRIASFLKRFMIENGFVNTVARCRELDHLARKKVY
eukprot:TRINITY_DN2578_c0_g1_i1.p1 TRINITY_DN2578_c0_g1~~TRINITY_DN2578_c0_g1_i1.p1  ORF type:complete len:328 (+),score=68.29 TRINITY_DN2578_c0_g1_i1:46-984(+)